MEGSGRIHTWSTFSEFLWRNEEKRGSIEQSVFHLEFETRAVWIQVRKNRAWVIYLTTLSPAKNVLSMIGERNTSMVRWCNYIDRGNRSTRSNTCFTVTLPARNPAMTAPGTKPDLRDEGAVYNRLSHDILTESVCKIAKFKTRWFYKLLTL